MMISRGSTTLSLLYLNYPTQVVFKSGKVFLVFFLAQYFYPFFCFCARFVQICVQLLTVMIGSVFMSNKSYPWSSYVAAALLTLSGRYFRRKYDYFCAFSGSFQPWWHISIPCISCNGCFDSIGDMSNSIITFVNFILCSNYTNDHIDRIWAN